MNVNCYVSHFCKPIKLFQTEIDNFIDPLISYQLFSFSLFHFWRQRRKWLMWVVKGQGSVLIAICYLRVTQFCLHASQIKLNLYY